MTLRKILRGQPSLCDEWFPRYGFLGILAQMSYFRVISGQPTTMQITAPIFSESPRPI